MLLDLKNVSLNLGSTVLLDHVDLTIQARERVCLIGRNGSGKSTLFRLITGEARADEGEIRRAAGARIANLPQDLPQDREGSAYEVVAEGLGEAGRLVAEYHRILESAPDDLQRLSEVQVALEAVDGWTLESRVVEMLTRLRVPGEMPFNKLSGGLKRRVLLGQALVAQPDLLLLDEPTNHLDVDSIRWLEEFLLDWSGTLLFITHDRAFLRRMATRIVELDRGILRNWACGYDQYLQRKADSLHAEQQQNALFDKRLAQEEAWIRKGVEARRTRSQGRVQRLKAMREQYAQRRQQSGQAKLVLQEAERSGRLVAEADRVSFARAGRPIIHQLSTTILRGDKIGIIGPNGAGKTTLLNLLLGRLAPDDGQLRIGTRQAVAYFDQLRAQLEEERPVFENIGEGKEFVEINGVRKHVMSYLQEFLFAPDRARSPVKSLSGGERSRLLLARLFAQPANIVVLDEPTNDLDIETLDLLEELLIDYAGTVLLVSHDREFLNNVVTRCLVLEGGGRVGDYVGGYDDWLRQRPEAAAAAPAPAATRAEPRRAPAAQPAARLSAKEKRELERLPGHIEALEAEQSRLAASLSDGRLYAEDRAQALAVQQRIAQVQAELTEAYARWERLEAAH